MLLVELVEVRFELGLLRPLARYALGNCRFTFTGRTATGTSMYSEVLRDDERRLFHRQILDVGHERELIAARLCREAIPAFAIGDD